MRLDTLEFYIRVVDCQSISRAAESLFISPQGLSKALSNLENDLGVALFRRNDQIFSLTEEGEVFYAYAVEVAKRTVSLFEDLRMMQFGKDGSVAKAIHLLAMPFISTQFLDLVLPYLSKGKIVSYTTEEISFKDIADITTESLNERDVVAFALPKLLVERIALNKDTTIIPICRTDLIVTASRKLISPKRNGITVQELSKIPIAYYNEPILNYYIKQLPPLKLNIIQHSSNKEAIERLVLNGEAATFSDTLSQYIKPIQNKEFCTFRIKPEESVYLGFIVKRDLSSDAPAKSFVDSVLSLFKNELKAYYKNTQWTI